MCKGGFAKAFVQCVSVQRWVCNGVSVQRWVCKGICAVGECARGECAKVGLQRHSCSG